MIDKPKVTILVATDGCSGSNCNTVFATDRGTRIVRGDTVARDAIDGLAAHETDVEVSGAFYDNVGRQWAREHGLLPS
jgi:hypothetical protein